MGFQDVVMALPYGDAWRKQRRLLERGLKKDAMPLYSHVQAEKVHLLLEQLLDDSANFAEHFTTYVHAGLLLFRENLHLWEQR